MRIRNFLVVYLFFQAISFLLLLQTDFQPVYVLFILLSIILLLPTLFMDIKWGTWLTLFLFYGLSSQYPEFLFFLPGAWYMVGRHQLLKSEWVLTGLLLLFLLKATFLHQMLLAVLIGLAYVLSRSRIEQQQLEARYHSLKDDSWEKEQLLRHKNEELQASQAAIIQLEIAEERNRIARDIHDNVGHLLSSAIIQLGALEVINRDARLQPPLKHLQATIHTGMDAIRESVHNLHEDSLSFREGILLLLEEFHFCPVTLQGDLSERLTHEQSKVLLLIIKEALANVMKHSDASQVTIEQTELPAFYRCRISDNGRKQATGKPKGIGLLSMNQRASELNGQLHLNQSEQGFVVTIILPKEAQT